MEKNRAADQEKKPLILAVSGVKNSGKTTLIAGLLPRLRAFGWKVATIKHDGHDFEPDVPGTDTYRHRQAGAYGTAIFSGTRLMVIKEAAVTERELFAAFPEADLILLEGLKHSPYPKIEIVREGNSKKIVCDPETLLGIATDRKDTGGFPAGTAVYHLNDWDGIAGAIRAYVEEMQERPRDKQKSRGGEEERVGMLLLMGGKSTRMGTAKAQLLYEGEPFWKRIAGQMAACGPLYLSVAKNSEYTAKENLFVPCRGVIPDEIEAVGPMGGIYSAMRGLEEDAFFVCACDMPLMSRGYIEALLAFWRERSEKEVWDGLMVRNRQGRIYTTAGIYHRRMLPVLEEKIRQGNYRMMAFLRECRVGYLEEESLGEQSRALTNINTVEDYEKLPDPHKG